MQAPREHERLQAASRARAELDDRNDLLGRCVRQAAILVVEVEVADVFAENAAATSDLIGRIVDAVASRYNFAEMYGRRGTPSPRSRPVPRSGPGPGLPLCRSSWRLW